MGHSESFERALREAELRVPAGASAQAEADAIEADREKAARVRSGLLAYQPYKALNQRLKGYAA